MKYIYRASKEQLQREQERQLRYLNMFLSDSDRCKVSGYIKECYKVLNAVKLALASK